MGPRMLSKLVVARAQVEQEVPASIEATARDAS